MQKYEEARKKPRKALLSWLCRAKVLSVKVLISYKIFIVLFFFYTILCTLDGDLRKHTSKV
jgi:hypothetical protein